MFRDQRDFVEGLEKYGDLVRVKEPVDWELEAAALNRLTCQLQGPAILMENIKDYPGQQLLAAPLSTLRRVAIAMGMEPDCERRELRRIFEERLEHPIMPIVVDEGQCQENIFTEEDANLFDLASPYVHEGDGGRYLLSWGFVVTKDYYTDWVNWGMYRQMVHNENTLGGLCNPLADIGIQYYQGWEPSGEKMPFATIIGGDIISTFVSAAPYGVGQSEVEYAGGLLLKPVELVKCVTVPLLVPANAEVVIEGYVSPRERCYEGPFGEWTGYRGSPRLPRIAYHVTAITHRDNPVIPITCMGTPIIETNTIGSTLGRSIALKRLRETGLPVVDVASHPEMWATTFVSIKKVTPSNVQEIGRHVGGHVFVFDDDIDVHNLGEVLHAFSTKCHPGRGIYIARDTATSALTPYLSLEERTWARGVSVVFDCTWPREWSPGRDIPVRSSFWDIYSERTIERCCQIWEKNVDSAMNFKQALEEYRAKARWPKAHETPSPKGRKR